jgi:hypothetical protein
VIDNGHALQTKVRGQEAALVSVVDAFYCLAIFDPSEISDWLDEALNRDGEIKSYELTACCPRCGIDSVIGSASGYPITREFLQTMKSYWF